MRSGRRYRVALVALVNGVTTACPERALHIVLDDLSTHMKNAAASRGVRTGTRISRQPSRRGGVTSRSAFPSLGENGWQAHRSSRSAGCSNTSIPSSLPERYRPAVYRDHEDNATEPEPRIAVSRMPEANATREDRFSSAVYVSTDTLPRRAERVGQFSSRSLTHSRPQARSGC